MIKLFSLNHTRTRKFLILAQDKTQFRRVTVKIFHVRNTSASAHTNYLVNFLKSARAVAQSRLRILHRFAALSTAFLKNLQFVFFKAFKRLPLKFRPCSVSTPSSEMRILQTCTMVSTVV